ncbi:MAG: DUF3798 domain-containing protein [Christensenellaceae bacterium]|nr:DUF3798 domain-containing protein [Christensenellaceae bacterium]
MKKILSIILTLVMVFSLATVFADEAPGKIAILTGTVSQGEEEFRAAEAAKAKYGDRVVTDTYPDNFMAEQETTVSKIQAFASDPTVKAIIVCQAVPGTKAGFDKIREMGRDDILLIAGVPQEDPGVISEAADIVMYADEAIQGDLIMETLDKWGVDVLIHYSFPRHMAMELIVARHNLLAKNAEALGIELVDRTAPDPTAEAGVSASQQFILEDVPKVMEEYAGKKVAFFTTNCGMQEPLQTAVLAAGENAYYPQPCCPSPFHGFPSSLGLISEGESALQYSSEDMLKKIAAKLAETNSEGRFSTWPAPVNMALIQVGADYAIDYIDGNIADRNDADALTAIFNESLPGADLTIYKDANGEEIANFYLVTLQPVDFNDYK